MKAMILAAGEGRRMRPLTNTMPKPLLSVASRPLIEHHIVRLRDAGFTQLVVNVSHLGQQIVEFLAAGGPWNVDIQISEESMPLETAGGIVQALPLLGSRPFLLVNADIFTDYPFADLRAQKVAASGAHIVLVSNPAHNAGGDFGLRGHHVELLESESAVFEKDDMPSASLGSATYSGLGVYDPGLFSQLERAKQPLKPLLDKAIHCGKLSGELYAGIWEDVGTPERLTALNERFPSASASQ